MPQVLFLATCREPGALDPAILRPGRLDYLIEVAQPTAEHRRAFLRRLLAAKQAVARRAQRARLGFTPGARRQGFQGCSGLFCSLQGLACAPWLPGI